ncbi:cobalamin-dependent protein, partial [Myxococcota bacterium]|nr:cobalamin-dependent protein [Myxococcota bacterium]
MKILLIHTQHEIQRFGTGVYKKHLRYAPITMPTLAALVPPELNAEVLVVDEMVEAIDLSIEADLVGLTAITSASSRAYELADHFKKRGATVVMGGIHATFMSDEALEHVDAVVHGYAEESWPQLLRDFAKGELKKVYEAPDDFDASRIVSPDRSYIKRSKYVANNTVEMSRSCSKKCAFCIAPRFHAGFVTKEIDAVIEDIRS